MLRRFSVRRYRGREFGPSLLATYEPHSIALRAVYGNLHFLNHDTRTSSLDF